MTFLRLRFSMTRFCIQPKSSFLLQRTFLQYLFHKKHLLSSRMLIISSTVIRNKHTILYCQGTGRLKVLRFAQLQADCFTSSRDSRQARICGVPTSSLFMRLISYRSFHSVSLRKRIAISGPLASSSCLKKTKTLSHFCERIFFIHLVRSASV